MSDSVSWGFYIGNYTFLVGVAAAAIMLVIPAYIYHWQPIKEIVILGELLAISAVVMVFAFVTVDMGHPDRFWHMMPGLGQAELPLCRPRLGRHGPEPVPAAQRRDRRLPAVQVVHGPAGQPQDSSGRWSSSRSRSR